MSDNGESGQSNKVQHLSCWCPTQNGLYTPGFQPVPRLPAGAWEIDYSELENRYYLKPYPPIVDDIISLPSMAVKHILDDIEQFWTNADMYSKMNIPMKRGILIYGKPGTSKSTTMKIVINKMISNWDGLVFSWESEEQFFGFSNFISTIRKVESHRKILVCIEDLDRFAKNERIMPLLLNLLDGINSGNNILYLASTNFPELLEDRIANRPGRFDLRIELPLPDSELRKFYLENKFNSAEFRVPLPIDEIVNDTAGFAISHLKELVILAVVMKREIPAAIKYLRELNNIPSLANSNREKIGFGIGKNGHG
jgi:hypothetical protein